MEPTPDFLEIFISWIPMLILIGAWAWYMRKNNRTLTGKSGKGYGELVEELVFEMRRQNDLVERLVEDQGERIKKLEEK